VPLIPQPWHSKLSIGYGSPLINEGVGAFERSTSGAGWASILPPPPRPAQEIFKSLKKIKGQIPEFLKNRN